MVNRTRARRTAAVALTVSAVTVLSACSSSEEQVRSHLDDNYERVNSSGSYAAYRSDDSVDTVADDIENAVEPGRELEDSTGEYLGYEDVMVHVEDEQNGSGSTIEVTDASDGYDRWGPVLVPVWGTFGGSYRNAFSGGGMGFGK